MKKYLILVIILLMFSCSEPENTIYIEEFKWTLKIPKEFEPYGITEDKMAQIKGINMIESAHPNKKVEIVAKTILNYKLEKYNFIKAQFSEINPDESYADFFKSSNDILIKSLTKERPNLKFETSESISEIDNNKFNTFRIKTLYENADSNYELTIYSKLFETKHLEIITMSNNTIKKEVIEDIIYSSKFDL